MQRNDVTSTSFLCHVPTRFLINQCQIITFLILKYDIIENSRTELRGIVLPVQVGGLLGGPKGMLAPPSQIIGGGPGPPSSYAYATLCFSVICIKGNNFSDFLFGFLEDKVLPKWGLLLKERICSFIFQRANSSLEELTPLRRDASCFP